MTMSDAQAFVIAYESGEIEDTAEIVEGFQSLIDSGLIFHLQGCYGRTAAYFIRTGVCTPRSA